MRDDRTFCGYQGELLHRRNVNGLAVMEATYASHLKLPNHSHRNAGFCHILRGEYTESYGKTVLECRPTDVKFQPAQEEHSDRYGQGGVRCFVVELNPGWLARMGASALVANSPALFRDGSVAWLMMRLRQEILSHDDGAQVAIEGLILQLIAEASRRKVSAGDGNPRWLQQTIEVLHDQFTEPLTLSDIAQSVGVHPVYLASAFRRHYHCSVGEYLRRLRIEYACSRMASRDTPIVDVALSAGFSNQSHFTRIFKRLTGMTPARYRSATRSS
jgi:AraC family transcriptional regulator